MSEEDWEGAWKVAKKCSPDALTQETSFKVLAYWYWVPTWSAKTTQGTSLLCVRNCGKHRSFLDILWTCP